MKLAKIETLYANRQISFQILLAQAEIDRNGRKIQIKTLPAVCLS